MLEKSFLKFKNKYPYLIDETLLNYFSLFGGVEEFYKFNFLTKSKEEILLEIRDKSVAQQIYPFFIFQEPFSSILTTIARGNKKYFSVLNKNRIGIERGLDIINELINNNILTVVESREKPIKQYVKQKIKKELREYKIEPKLFFVDPFIRTWFSYIEPYIKSETMRKSEMIKNFNKYAIKSYSLTFEHLSSLFLKQYFKLDTIECASYWDIHSEFDIYCKTNDNKFIVGECKYSNRVVTKAEFVKLEYKIVQSNLNSDYIAFFSKLGFSKELEKLSSDRVLLFTLKDIID